MYFIDPRYRKNLSLYKYSGADKSLVSRYVLTPYWNWLVQLFPKTVAPNLITLLGLLCVIVNVLTLLYYSPDLGTCPNWVYFSFGVGLFVYQSLDAIDGKQARRTGTSGPLGELFDHGCDALNTTLSVLTAASTLALGSSWYTQLSLFSCICNFYLSTWEEYHTGTLYLSAFSGPVEGILMIVGLHFISGIFGNQIWTHTLSEVTRGKLPLPDIVANFKLNEAFMVFGAIGLLFNIAAACNNVITATRAKKEPIMKPLLGLIPFTICSLLAYAWLVASPTLVTEHCVLWSLYIGLSFGYTVGQVITAHVTKAPFPYVNIMMAPLMIGAVNANLPFLANTKPFYSGLNEVLYVVACFGFALFMYALFALSVINDICDYFDINCLTIKHKEEKKSE
ncbi:hypothetical protein BZG36_01822 [Bifiguratus adelaidae]|uniref:diacylglycerol cholinephosphotransferase n=1 Tax=Bifiguratus adelaidae TaxID=1938954 RepID=A0A261Y2B4_9FUNG|nr:hypothetical protein BZG36_01822 [Bifiguratus adelaidae]